MTSVSAIVLPKAQQVVATHIGLVAERDEAGNAQSAVAQISEKSDPEAARLGGEGDSTRRGRRALPRSRSWRPRDRC